MIKDRKKKIANIIIKNDRICSHLNLYRLLNNGLFDYAIKYIGDTPTDCSEYVSKTKKLDGEEQFVYSLEHFVSFFEFHFYFLSRNESTILYHVFKNRNNAIFLVTKDNWDSNELIPVFTHSMKRVFVTNFFYILLETNKSSKKVKKFLKQQRIDIEKYDLSNSIHVDNLFELLKKLSYAISKSNNSIYLFKDINDYEDIEEKKEEYISALLLAEKLILERAIEVYKLYKDSINLFC